MEKISLVKRRKKGLFEPGKGQPPEAEGGSSPVQQLTKIPSHVLRKSTDSVDEPGDLSDKKERAISIKLTPEQYNLVKSSQYVNYFLNGESSGVSLDIQQCLDGQVVFNFQFKKADTVKKVDTVKMLKSEHVCQMLQISKSHLMTLVKSQKIRSYKIGRLRRFLLEDILDYLSKSEEIFINSKA